MMQLKHVFFFIFLLSTAFVHATTWPEPTWLVEDCSAPAPNNFRTTSINSTSVDLAWDYVSEAQGGYRVRTYRTSDNALVSTLYLLQNELNVTVNNLTAGEEYISVINPRCLDATDSGNQTSVTYKALIVELIVSGYTSPSNTVVGCSITTTSQKCSFQNFNDSATPFKFSNPSGVSRYFWAGYNGNNPAVFLQKSNDNSGSPLTFYCSSGLEAQCPLPGQSNSSYIIVKDNGVVVARIGISNNGGIASSQLSCSLLTANYKVERLDPLNPPREERDAAPGVWAQPAFAKVSPNPFNDHLDVQIEGISAQQIQAKLMNLSGQVVLERTFDGAQAQYALPTADLAPGFYLLRIEADGSVQTLKVVKAK